MSLYLVEKVAVYKHGVGFVSPFLGEAVAMADTFASTDLDNHHYYVVLEYTPYSVGDAPGTDFEHKEIYRVSKGHPGKYAEEAPCSEE